MAADGQIQETPQATFEWLNDAEDRSMRGRMYSLRAPSWMWRVSVMLLLTLPLVFVFVPNDTLGIAALLTWMVLALPMCILHAVDFCEQPQTRPVARLLQAILRIPIGIFGFLSLLLGIAMLVWIAYNVFIHREPEFATPFGILDALARGGGMACLFVGLGISLTSLAWRRISADRD